MQAAQIEGIKEQLLATIPQFGGNGYVIQKGDDESFKGITDAISFWFYIDFQDGVESFEFDNSTDLIPNKTAYQIIGNYKLIAGMCGTNKHNAIDVLVSALSSFGVDVQKAWTDPETILGEEWENKKLKSDLQLYRVDFTLTTYKTGLIDCLTLICDDGKC